MTLFGIADHARGMTLLQLEREIAAAVSCGADADYIEQLQAVAAERRAAGERDTEPPPSGDSGVA